MVVRRRVTRAITDTRPRRPLVGKGSYKEMVLKRKNRTEKQKRKDAKKTTGEKVRDELTQTSIDAVGGQFLGDAYTAATMLRDGKVSGEEAGSAIGGTAGAAAGGAIGATLGGPTGAVIGEQVGGYAGSKAGGYLGKHGEDLARKGAAKAKKAGKKAGKKIKKAGKKIGRAFR